MGDLGKIAGTIGGGFLAPGLFDSVFGNSTAAAPNPADLIGQQTTANRQAAETQARLNRVDEVNPLGSSTFSGFFNEEEFQRAEETFQQKLSDAFARGATSEVDAQARFGVIRPNRDDFERTRRTTELNPTAQQAFDEQQQLGLLLSQLAGDQFGRVGETLGQPLDFSGLPPLPELDEQARSRIETSLFNRQAGRLNPRFEDEQRRLDTLLANQGIQRGSEAFSSEQERFGRTRNDAFDLAISNAISGASGEQGRLFGLQSAARNQGLQELLTQRNQPINDISALLSQSQLNVPNFGGISQVGVAAPDVLGANALSLNQQNLQSQLDQQLQNNLFGLGGSLGSAAILSDRRFKKNVKKFGVLESGINVYTFNYLFDDQPMMGVMADEVKAIKPHAVETRYGIDYVDYMEVLTNAAT